jgi:hypothetical protein
MIKRLLQAFTVSALVCSSYACWVNWTSPCVIDGNWYCYQANDPCVDPCTPAPGYNWVMALDWGAKQYVRSADTGRYSTKQGNGLCTFTCNWFDNCTLTWVTPRQCTIQDGDTKREDGDTCPVHTT